MSETVVEIAGKHLGQTVGQYSDTYDPSLLVKVPRYMNRDTYNIKEDKLPFIGHDVWNAYEVSAITNKGLPVSGVLKICYACESMHHVESKSLKLYLNSFNMEPLGHTAKECIKIIEDRVSTDLSKLLETNVAAKLHRSVDLNPYGNDTWIGFSGYDNIEQIVDLDTIDFSAYKSDASQLQITSKIKEAAYHSDLLRSNCRVTNQPDWGDIYVYMKGSKTITPKSFAKYIVSHRKVSHFHEEICEMIYKQIWDRCKPDELMVACLYTRRGGIDINPIRASHPELIPERFQDVNYINEKTLRQ